MAGSPTLPDVKDNMVAGSGGGSSKTLASKLAGMTGVDGLP